jgi:energy-converting hydrogenase A subunit M
MDFIKLLCLSYSSHNLNIEESVDRLKKKIKQHEKQIENLEKRIKKLYDSDIFWMDALIVPLAEELNKKFPEFQHKIIGPLGICSKCHIHFFRKSEKELGWEKYHQKDNLISITILPGSIKSGELFFENGETKNSFAKGTIGEINGMNFVSKPIHSINQLVEHLLKQIPINDEK